MPATDETFTTAPEPRSRIAGRNAWIMRDDAEEVGVEHTADLGERDGLDRAFDSEARVVHEHIDRTDRRERRRDRGIIVDVELPSVSATLRSSSVSELDGPWPRRRSPGRSARPQWPGRFPWNSR